MLGFNGFDEKAFVLNRLVARRDVRGGVFHWCRTGGKGQGG